VPDAYNAVITSQTTPDEGLFFVRVAAKRTVAQGTICFDLVATDGALLPAFTAGAHVTVVTPMGARRNYSLCSDPHDLARYQIAVKRQADGRGGSQSLVDKLHEGAQLRISAPRNHFELISRAQEFIFIAGGIGITPILSMLRQLQRTDGARYTLYYCTRDAESSAFLEALRNTFAGSVVVHHDHGDPSRAYDFWPVLETPSRAHVYCCGPASLMDSVADMTGHWPSGSVHFERFGVDAKVLATNAAFTVRLKNSAHEVNVAAQQTLLEALRAHGCTVRSSCESGTCGSCKTGLISGDVDHRDAVLSQDERSTHIMPCVSRARAGAGAGELVLDL
jgi:phthalate 4,5-dioxygenase reductase component